MQLSGAGLALIRQFEGYRSKIYLDTAGLPTIGYGHLLRANEVGHYANGIDVATAQALLRADVYSAVQAVQRFMEPPLQQRQFDALVSFTFNVGAGALQRSTLRRVINRGEYAEAPAQFMRYIWAGGKRSKGLTLRRAAEVRMFTG